MEIDVEERLERRRQERSRCQNVGEMDSGRAVADCQSGHFRGPLGKLRRHWMNFGSPKKSILISFGAARVNHPPLTQGPAQYIVTQPSIVRTYLILVITIRVY